MKESSVSGFSPTLSADLPGNVARTVNDATTNQIREWILNGTLTSGERLHQDQLASALAVSRMPVREAIRQLSAEGLVQVIPHRGAFVTSLDPNAIRDLYEVRAALEGLAVRHAVPAIGEEDIAKLHELFDQLKAAEQADDDEQTIEIDRRFHDVLMSPAAMPYLLDLIEQARRRAEVFRRANTYLRATHTPEANREHAAIIAAVEARNAEDAVRLTEFSLRKAAGQLIDYLTHKKDDRP
jgi:DNA-binding GntR family transcriptional regulator